MQTTFERGGRSETGEAARRSSSERPVMFQSWRELLFLHWRFPVDALRAWVPAGLTLDTFEGEAWVGIVPFFMRNIRPRWSPAVPGVSNFLELNLRTYVRDGEGVPGVWFFSLDANQRLAVWWGRTLFHLPYQAAKMRANHEADSRRVRFISRRQGADSRWTCRYDYRPAGASRRATPGSLEHFLIERYHLFARSRGGVLYRGRVEHAPYEFADAHLQHWDEHLLELNRLPLPGRRPDHAVVSPGVDVRVFRPLRGWPGESCRG